MKKLELELLPNKRIPAKLRVKYFKQAVKNGMKLLTYDIETSHMVVRSWNIGRDISLSHENIISPSKVISIQYMWSEDKKAKFLGWDKVRDDGIGAQNFCDQFMLHEFVDCIVPQADILLTQNGDHFDSKIINQRLMIQKLITLDSIPSLDILKLSRSSFRSPSHKLDYRSKAHKLGGKIKMTDQDWVDVEENGVPVSKKMGPYGCKDVEDTLALFWEELPYYKTLPIAVENIVIDYLVGPGFRDPRQPVKVFCPSCRERRRKATDVEHVKNKTFLCNNCNKKFRQP